MLVLSRKSGERIVIGSNIVIDVIVVRGGRVKLGLSAPSDTTIVRKELCAENKGQRLNHQRPAVQSN